MSAYIVKDKTINRVVTWLSVQPEFLQKRVAGNAEIEIEDPEFRFKLGLSMYKLNVDAVNERYQENHDPDLSFKARHEFANRIQVLKSLRCWLYQCTEGEAVTRPLYKAMETLRDFLALEIVESMPKYEAAEWA